MVRGAMRWRALALVAAVALVAAACGGDDDEEVGDGSPATTEGADEVATDDGTYADLAHWLCHPDLDEADDVCARDLDTTLVQPDGTLEVEPFEAAEDPPVDCFYVYPTISQDEGVTADLEPAEGEEVYVTHVQAARFSAACRVFAPVYRQITLTNLTARLGAQGEGTEDGEEGQGSDGGQDSTGDEEPDQAEAYAGAYQDVVDAFRHYVEADSEGRGFVLIGHSQGSGHLTRLLAEEIEPDPELHDRLVSALLLGSSVSVVPGEDTGSDLPETPLCRALDQTGCVVTYASFRTESPPTETSLFGASRVEGETAGCVNPAAPGGGSGTLTPYFAHEDLGGTLGGPAPAFADPARESEITTTWIALPGLVSARCVSDGTRTWLDITVTGDPADPRVDDIGGDLTPEWGLHLVDVSVAMGDLVAMVSAQAEAYAG